MVKVTTNQLESIFGKKVRKQVSVIGFDTASRTGWCRIDTTKRYANFEYGFVDVEAKNKLHKYNQCIDIFNDLIVDVDTVVIEDTFLKFNVQVFQLLSRLGGFVYAIAHLKQVKRAFFVSPTASRAFLGLEAKAKKEQIHKELRAKLPMLDVKDSDILDAIVLALNGVLEDNKLDV